MDRNSVIGMVLIGALLLLYFNYFAPAPEPPQSTPPNQTVAPGRQNSIPPAQRPVPQAQVQRDSSRLQRGGLFALLAGLEEEVRVENQDMVLVFSSRGGVFKQVHLKGFKAYNQRPLNLINGGSSSFALHTQYEGEDIDLYALHYTASSLQRNDTTMVVFTAQVGEDAFLKHVYAIPPVGYEVAYSMESKGLRLAGDLLAFTWNNRILLQERHMEGSRNKTTVNYYTADGDFDGLSELSSEEESETLVKPLKWVAVKQKFFVSALIADNAFKGGEISSSVNAADSSTVKDAYVKLFIPRQDIAEKTARFRYFFGPTSYSLLKRVTTGFSKNLNLGWPPIVWVNQYLIIPIFKFLESYINNYGIIIIILVLVIKMILSPLSYKSYLGMAKMKLLKPELDLLKEKHNGDMAKVQQEQLKLYQQAGVNPFSGCIPLILQMPILFAMFYFFPVSIELRQSAFLWAEDLSTYDSILELPFTIPFYGSHVSLFVLLMTASTLVYTWQNNQISSAQGPMKSVSYFMPVIFMFVLNSFSAGLSFYYFVANLVTFAQQAIIRRFVNEDKIKGVMEEHRKKNLSGGGKRSRLMAKLQEAMKAGEERRGKGKK